MIDRIFYTLTTASAVAAAVLFSIAAYQRFKKPRTPSDNVYPLQRRTS